MKSIYKVCFLALILLCTANQEALGNSFFVHIDKPMYTTGETVWYSVSYPTTIEKVAIKVLLVNSEGQVVQDFFQNSSKSTNMSGHLYIPYNYRSGVYRLIFNTNIKGKNNSSQVLEEEITLAEISFPIYNDLYMKGQEAGTTTDASADASKVQADFSLQIKSNLGNTSYGVRDQINLDLDVSTADNRATYSEISVSVIPKNVKAVDQLGLQYYAQGDLFQENNTANLSENIYLKGRVYDLKDKAVQLNVIGAYTDKLNTMYYTKSDAEGSFTLNFPNFYDKQRVQFLSYAQEIEDFKVTSEPHAIAQRKLPPLLYNEEIENYLEQSRKRKKLVQHFAYLESNLDLARRSDKAPESEADIVFVVNEYEKFEDVYGFFSELITPLQFKKVKGKIVASMSNPKSNNAMFANLPGNPLFIVDGKATRNADYAGKLSMSNIETVELFYSAAELRKQFNVLGSSGVVRIKTLTPLFDVPESDTENFAEINGLPGAGKFSAFVPKSNSNSLPQFNTTIYWNPEVKTDKNGKANITFYQTDDVGEFSIIIIAHDKDGNRGVKVIDYEVK